MVDVVSLESGTWIVLLVTNHQSLFTNHISSLDKGPALH